MAFLLPNLLLNAPPGSDTRNGLQLLAGWTATSTPLPRQQSWSAALE